MFRDGALIDVAQDHALHHLHVEGLFDFGLVFKGGTALRKFRLGNEGRFSTDLDFAVDEPGLAELVMERLDGAAIEGFSFRVKQLVPGRRALLHIDSPCASAAADKGKRKPMFGCITPISNSENNSLAISS